MPSSREPASDIGSRDDVTVAEGWDELLIGPYPAAETCSRKISFQVFQFRMVESGTPEILLNSAIFKGSESPLAIWFRSML